MTIAYKPNSGFWSSRYSYDTSCFSRIDNRMISFDEYVNGPENTDNEIAWEHRDDSPKCTFYGGSATRPFIKLTVNDNPSKNKVYRAMSLEGSNLLTSETQFYANNSSQPTQRRTTLWNNVTEKGGIFYSGVGRVYQTSTGNNLKIIGEITRAVTADDIEEYLGANTPEEWVGTSQSTLMMFQVRPIGGAFTSSASQDVMGDAAFPTIKYFLGTRYGNAMRVFAPQYGAGLGRTIIENRINGRGIPHEELDDRLLPTTIGPKRRATWFAIQPSPGDLQASIPDFTDSVNEQLAEDRYFLFESSAEEINGEDPRGQYADVWISLPVSDFELYAVNVDYAFTDMDHGRG